MIIQVLLIIMSVLCLMSGIVAFFGSTSKRRTAVFWYLIATIGAAAWALAIATFLRLDADGAPQVPLIVTFIYSSPLLLVVGLLGNNSWDYKIGRVVTVIAALIGAVFATMISTSPSLLYDGFILGPGLGDNSVCLLAAEPFYIAYVIYFIAVIGSAMQFTLLTLRKEKKTGHRITSDIIFLIGLSLTSLAAFVTDLLLPPFNYDLIWVGPLAMVCGNIGFYYKLIKKRLTVMKTGWMTTFSYVIMAAVASMAYLVVFYLIFTTLFRGSEPSLQVVILNFIMFLIVILSMPAMREVASALTSLISIDKVDMSYVIKKLNQLAGKKKNYQELAEFLADHMHFTYLGFIIDNKIYGSTNLKFDKADIAQIAAIPASKTLWQVPSEATQLTLNKYGINAVAPLGSPNRQILIGKPLGKQNLKKSDLADIETIINLVAALL